MGLVARKTAVLLGGAAFAMAAGVFHTAAQDGASDGTTVLESIEVKAKRTPNANWTQASNNPSANAATSAPAMLPSPATTQMMNAFSIGS